MREKEQKVSIHAYETLKSATNVCKRCFKSIISINFGDFSARSPLCNACLDELNPNLRCIKLLKTNIYWIYDYNESFRNSLYLLKGCGDYEMRKIFLERQSAFLHLRFFNRIVVPAPSYRARDENRGFNHVVSIFESLNLPIENCLIKTEDRKQADMSKEERAAIKDYIRLQNTQKLVGKRVLFVDDVMTTGSTLKACVQLIKEAGAKSVDALVLARVAHP